MFGLISSIFILHLSFFPASVSVGAADAAIEAVKEHLTVRKQFGKQLKEFQVELST